MLKRTHRFGVLSLLAVASLLVSACDNTSSTPAPQTGPTATPTTDNRVEAKIGFAFVTSGDNATYGVAQKAAAELAIVEINALDDGPRLEAIFEDTASDPDQALAVFKKLIGIDNVDAIIGPTLSNEAKTADPEAQTAGVPVLAVSNTATGITDIGDYIFRDSLAEAQVIPETIKQAKDELHISKVVLMYASDDAFSKSGADVFRAELQKQNIEILGEQTFSTSDTDFKTQLAAAKAMTPDAIVVSALINPAKLITRQARNDAGISAKTYIIGGNGFNSPSLITSAGTASEGIVVGSAWNLASSDQLSQQFVTNYKKAAGKDPDQFAAQSYAGVYIMYDAIKRANIKDKSLKDARTAIRDALKSTSNHPTVLGNFSFTDKRDADHPPVVQVVRNGKFELLKQK
ncbi:MAG: ABC transporter substrate-binding protein [Chloroflexia bacterium]